MRDELIRHNSRSSAQTRLNRPQIAGICAQACSGRRNSRFALTVRLPALFGPESTTRLPCRRSWVRIPLSASPSKKPR
jgi:hypothetical protein